MSSVTQAKCYPLLEKSTAHTVTDIVNYIPGIVANITILKKLTGEITVLSFDIGQGSSEKISAFDIFLLVIEGTAGLMIDRKSFNVATGEGIIVPAHSSLLRWAWLKQ
jgi:hypothetical protein